MTYRHGQTSKFKFDVYYYYVKETQTKAIFRKGKTNKLMKCYDDDDESS
jgi:hypothetical protein